MDHAYFDMMMFSALPKLVDGVFLRFHIDRPVNDLFIDSRKAIASPGAVFFAISGDRHDGHRFISSLYELGFRQFIVERDEDYGRFTESNIIRVPSSILALQKVAANHRSQFSIPIIGITGSNGKTILKEWLYQLLSHDLNIVKNPGSYNSQVGVPLSVWQLEQHHQLAIFEAGISRPGEMSNLEKIIKPTIGVFTNLGTAHDEAFTNSSEKIQEKIRLFTNAATIVYCKDHHHAANEIERQFGAKELVSWGTDPGSAIRIQKTERQTYHLEWGDQNGIFRLPFSDAASVENACHCVALLLSLKYSLKDIQERILKLMTIPMRLELKQGVNGCQLIDDTYNNDLAGLQICLDFLRGIQHKKSVVILSDILQSGLDAEILAVKIADLLTRGKVGLLIAIGVQLSAQRKIFESVLQSSFYLTTDQFLEDVESRHFRDEVILVKGARVFLFEKIVQRLLKKIHGTVMEIDLGAIVNNLNFFKSKLRPGVKIMAMVKAFAYGSGSEEIATLLQYHGIDYLGVAYADEGVDLRKNNIRLPIMVMNPSEDSFETIYAHNLEPEIFSLKLLKSFILFLKGRHHKIHLKIDSGMHRLGFERQDLIEAIEILTVHPEIDIASVFSHLAGADDESHNSFTREQANNFHEMSELLLTRLPTRPILHILNSSGILRFPEYQFGMVRLGIGLYGIDPASIENLYLQPVTTLKTVISQIKTIRKGQTIGYGRKGVAQDEMTLATIAIGYADGFSRAFGCGKGEVLIRGLRAPVIGNVCMDMTMVDITNIPTNEGDEVIIFGKGMPIVEVAQRINTIPYEILAGTSERVKRVFFAESI